MATLQEHFLNSFDDHYIISLTEGSTPLKAIYHQGAVRLIIKVETGSPFKSMRISRYRSYIEVPRDALYIDSVLINDVMYHYFELENG